MADKPAGFCRNVLARQVARYFGSLPLRPRNAGTLQMEVGHRPAETIFLNTLSEVFETSLDGKGEYGQGSSKLFLQLRADV